MIYNREHAREQVAALIEGGLVGRDLIDAIIDAVLAGAVEEPTETDYTGHVSVVGIRLEALAREVQSGKRADIEWEYDRVRRAVEKLAWAMGVVLPGAAQPLLNQETIGFAHIHNPADVDDGPQSPWAACPMSPDNLPLLVRWLIQNHDALAREAGERK